MKRKLFLDSVMLNNYFLVTFLSLCIRLVQAFAGVSLTSSGLLLDLGELDSRPEEASEMRQENG